VNNNCLIYFNNTLIKLSSRFQKVKKFAFNLLKGFAIESIAIIAMVFIASFFMQSIAPIASVALFIIYKNLALRAISQTFKASNFSFKNAVVIVINFIMAAQFAYLFNATIITLFHEMGHAITSYIMYIDPDPIIQIHPFIGGETSYLAEKLTLFGQFLGKKTANALISASGCFVTVIFSLLMLFISRKKSHTSEISIYLATAAIYTLASDSFYAFSALTSTSSNHDFVGLWQIGIHPLFSTFLFLISPFLLVLFNKKKSLATR